MKTWLIGALMFLGCAAQAYDIYGNNERNYKDTWGHSYKRYETLDKDSDGDGVSNRYDYNDRNRNVQYDWQAPYERQKKNRGW